MTEPPHFDPLLETAPIALAVLRGRQIVHANSEARRLFGYSENELTGAPITQLTPFGPFSGPSVAVGRDFVGLRKDGSEIMLEITCNSIVIPAGEAIVAAFVDITERKRNEKRLHSVIEAAPNAMVLVDGAGRIVLMNPEAERLFGYPRDEVLGKSVEKLVPSRFRDIHVKQRSGFLGAPTARAMGAGRDLFGLRKDGKDIPIEIGLNPLRLAGENYVLAAIIDISERKRAERLRFEYVEFGQQALASLDVKALKAEAVELISRTIGAPFVRIGDFDAQTNHVTFDAGVGWSAQGLAKLALDVASDPQVAHSIRTGQPVFVDHRAGADTAPIPVAGNRSIVASALIPIRGQDAIVGLLTIGTTEARTFSQDDMAFLVGVGTIVGMTIDRHRREEQIAHLNEKLQHRFDELESFSYSVAHDLRAPLRTIAGFAGALEEDHGAALEPEAQRFLGHVISGARKMSELIDALLALSRISRQEISRSVVDLSTIAESLIEELRASEPERVVDVSIQPNLTVTGDARLLRLILQNLFSNAWKFTRDSEFARIRLAGDRVERKWVFAVDDNGIGFSTPDSDELFIPFKRLHGEAYEGTGIGLATVARIVRRHGGRVWAQSEPGKGATFFFTIDETLS